MKLLPLSWCFSLFKHYYLKCSPKSQQCLHMFFYKCISLHEICCHEFFQLLSSSCVICHFICFPSLKMASIDKSVKGPYASPRSCIRSFLDFILFLKDMTFTYYSSPVHISFLSSVQFSHFFMEALTSCWQKRA